MDHLIQFILALPVKKISIALSLLRYLEDPRKKEILESLLLFAAYKKDLSEIEIKNLFFDPVLLEIERFNEEMVDVWNRNMQTILSEDYRIELNIKLFAASQHKKDFIELQKRIKDLLNLYEQHACGYAANTLTSLNSALMVVINKLPQFSVEAKKVEKVEAALKEKYSTESKEIKKVWEQKIKSANAVIDVYMSISDKDTIDRINLLFKLDYEIKLISKALEAFVENELVTAKEDFLLDHFFPADEKLAEEKEHRPMLLKMIDTTELKLKEFCEKNITSKTILSISQIVLLLSACVCDKGKDAAKRLENFREIFWEQQKNIEQILEQQLRVHNETVSLTVKIFLASVSDILMQDRQLFLPPLPAKSSWQSFSLFGYAPVWPLNLPAAFRAGRTHGCALTNR